MSQMAATRTLEADTLLLTAASRLDPLPPTPMKPTWSCCPASLPERMAGKPANRGAAPRAVFFTKSRRLIGAWAMIDLLVRGLDPERVHDNRGGEPLARAARGEENGTVSQPGGSMRINTNVSAPIAGCCFFCLIAVSCSPAMEQGATPPAPPSGEKAA